MEIKSLFKTLTSLDLYKGIGVGVGSHVLPELVALLAKDAGHHEAFFSHQGRNLFITGAKLVMRPRDRRIIDAGIEKGREGRLSDQSLLDDIRRMRGMING